MGAASRPRGPVDEGALLDAARRQAGLNDFGDEGFRGGLRALISGPPGKRLLLRRVTETLVSRLRIHEVLRRHPEIVQIPIARPVIIAALPRSGTTLLHNLLAQDPEARAPALWELQDPLPPPPDGSSAASSAEDPRIGRAIASMAHLPPEIRVAHEFDPLAPGECASLFRHSLVFPLWGLQSDAYFEWLGDHDLATTYAEYKQQLQLLRWSRPDAPARLVVKWSFHIWRTDALLATFPDAAIVLIHRDPTELVPSYCSLLSMQFRNAEPEAVGRFVVRYLAELARRMAAARDRFPSDRFLDLGYEELRRDPVGTVRRLYQRFGDRFSPDLEVRLRRWVAENPQGKHGVHRYGLADYGLEEDAVAARFADYRARFGIEPASVARTLQGAR